MWGRYSLLWDTVHNINFHTFNQHTHTLSKHTVSLPLTHIQLTAQFNLMLLVTRLSLMRQRQVQLPAEVQVISCWSWRTQGHKAFWAPKHTQKCIHLAKKTLEIRLVLHSNFHMISPVCWLLLKRCSKLDQLNIAMTRLGDYLKPSITTFKGIVHPKNK